MRVWDVPVQRLCRRHLLAEHAELHAVWSILTKGLRGYSSHPEVRRWEGRLAALHRRHDAQVREFTQRGYRHASPLDQALAGGKRRQTKLVDSIADQLRLLAKKGCGCQLDPLP